MNIKSIELQNWQLFKKEIISFSTINIIKGINQDVADAAGNGSGKTTILSAILFALFGDVMDSKLNLKDLISIGAKKAKVILKFEHKGQQWKIIRFIPSEVEIWIDEVKKDFNTATIAQTFIEEQIGTATNFKTYHLIDKIKGINLLDLGNVSLQGNLTGLMDSLFSTHRKSLNSKKLNVETYSIDKRFYSFHLSEKRLDFLKTGLNKLEEVHGNSLQEISDQTKMVNTTASIIDTNKSKIKYLTSEGQNKDKKGLELKDYIITNNKAAELLKNAPLKETPAQVDYVSIISKVEEVIANLESQGKSCVFKKEELNKQREKKELDKTILNGTLNQNNKERKQLELELKGLETAVIGTKCKHCGSPISEEHKEEYKNETLQKIKVLNQSDVVTDLQIGLYNIDITQLHNEIEGVKKQIHDTESNLIDRRDQVRKANNKKLDQEKILNELSQAQIKKDADIQQCLKSAEEANKQHSQLRIECSKLMDEIKTIDQETILLDNQVLEDKDYLKTIQDNELKVSKKIHVTERFIDKLQEAFKFEEYKYSKADMKRYADAIKVFDGFAAFYIKENLQNLEIIINDLLSPVNLSVEFTSDKEFLYLKDNGTTLKYGQLSSGQKTFLNCILKLGILLNEGKSDHLFIVDDGVSDIDKINLNKLLLVLEHLPFQSIIIYQNIEEVKYNTIVVERKNGESRIL